MTPFQVYEPLTRAQAKKIVKAAGAVWIQDRSTEAKHIYYSSTGGAWIAYEASPGRPGYFRLSFYTSCPCVAAL